MKTMDDRLHVQYLLVLVHDQGFYWFANLCPREVLAQHSSFCATQIVMPLWPLLSAKVPLCTVCLSDRAAL